MVRRRYLQYHLKFRVLGIYGNHFSHGTIQCHRLIVNLESAEAAGDSFETKPSLLADGLGTVTAALFGSPFPTTIYIGHPGWKNMGARSSYSVINGVVISLICFVGALSMIIKYTPLETTLGII